MGGFAERVGGKGGQCGLAVTHGAWWDERRARADRQASRSSGRRLPTSLSAATARPPLLPRVRCPALQFESIDRSPCTTLAHAHGRAHACATCRLPCRQRQHFSYRRRQRGRAHAVSGLARNAARARRGCGDGTGAEGGGRRAAADHRWRGVLGDDRLGGRQRRHAGAHSAVPAILRAHYTIQRELGGLPA